MDTRGGNGQAWRAHSLGLRRERLVRAMVQVVCEKGGFAGASLTALCAHAKISGAAFYEAFDSRESCFLAVLDEGHRRCAELVEQAFRQTESWLEGVRLAKAELLLFFDSNPELARVCIVESLAAGRWALEHRERHVASLTRMIFGRSDDPTSQEPHPFTSEGTMASVLGVIQGHLLAGRPEPLSEMLGPLMGLVTAPYLDVEAVAEEVERSSALTPRDFAVQTVLISGNPDRERVDVPAPLLDPRAHRARKCLLYLVDHPGASNREIGRAVGIGRDPQISTALARLSRLGLFVKQTSKPGSVNVWTPTSYGLSVARLLRDDSDAAEDENRLSQSGA